MVDASIAVPMALRGARPPRLRHEHLIAPCLLWSEATSALNELAFRGELALEAATAAIELLASLGIERTDEPRLHVEAFHLARAVGWAKTYDAEYVALARSVGAVLLTRDARLRRGASRLATVIGPGELPIHG